MNPKKVNNTPFYIGLCITVWLLVVYVVSHMANASIEVGSKVIFDYIGLALTNMTENPMNAFPLNLPAILWSTVVLVIAGVWIWNENEKVKVDAPGIENGSAKWFEDFKNYNKKYVDQSDKKNMIFSNEVKLNMNTRATRKNNNVLVIGGSGTGKSRFFVKPNMLQANCSYVITDPSGELLQTQAHFLESQGYKIKVFDLTDMSKSSHYNPFNYIRDENGVLQMIKCLIANTKGEGEKSDFWEKAETTLLLSLCFYLKEAMPPEEQNFANVMSLLKIAAVSEEDESMESELDLLMNALEKQNPESMAVMNYKDYKKAAGKTAKSILISAAVRLQAFNFKSVKELTSDDTLDMGSIGDNKQALFVVIPAADSTFNFLVSMMYSQLFETLYFHAEHDKEVCKGKRLPVHVRFLLDEFANIGTIPDFEKKLSTMRKYEISCSIILQSLSQLKAMYEKQWEVLIDNCDSLLFLGCQGKSTIEYINQKLGKTTIRSRDNSKTYGARGSSSVSRKHEGRDLMTKEEIAAMPDNNCILFIRGMDPFYCTKFSLEKHKNYQYSGDADEKFEYEYDPYKDNPKAVKKSERDEAALEEATNNPDVNPDRIVREQRKAEEINSGEEQVSKQGKILHQFKPIEETAQEYIEQGGDIEFVVDSRYDRNYEFKTTNPFMFDFESIDLEATEEGSGAIDVEEPDVNEFEEPDIEEPNVDEPDFDDADFDDSDTNYDEE